MSKTYHIEVHRTSTIHFFGDIDVKAKNKKEAIKKANEAFENGELDLLDYGNNGGEDETEYEVTELPALK